MYVVKRFLLVGSLLAIFALTISHRSPGLTSPARPPQAPGTFVPSRADLAEAVFAMVSQRAAQAGLPQPLTLCQACTAAHLGLPEATVRAQCRAACGLRPEGRRDVEQ